jgi:hypothetical protein
MNKYLSMCVALFIVMISMPLYARGGHGGGHGGGHRGGGGHHTTHAPTPRAAPKHASPRVSHPRATHPRSHGTSNGMNTRVRGYVKRSGVVVQPHIRSSKDMSRFNNYTTKGNINPFTGKFGTKKP